MFTSRSAMVGPKRFAMCSTRSTSSGAVLGPTIRCIPSDRSSAFGVSNPGAFWPSGSGGFGTSWSAMARAPAHPAYIHIDRHCDQDRESQVQVEVVRTDPLQNQAVLKDAQEQRADQSPDDGALASGHQRPADDHGRDREEQEVVGASGIG